MHRVMTMLVAGSVICLLLGACGQDTPEPTVAPEAATPTAISTPVSDGAATAEVTPASEGDEAASTAITDTTEVTSTEEVTSTDAATTTGSVDSAAATTDGAASTTVTVLSERTVAEVVGEDFPYYATVSPDGTAIAYAIAERRERNLCIFTFASADKTCYAVPDAYQNYPYELFWSPDSTLIAFTENPIQLGNESDIWLFDVAAGTFTNRTDDGVDGSFVHNEPGTYTLDYLPMWNQTDGNLYFWRSVPSGELSTTMELMRMAPTEGEPELVRDLSTETGQQLLLFDSEYYFLDGVSALSPDGNQLAMLVTSPLEAYDSPANGLWVVDLATQDSAPQQLMTQEQFQSALAPFQNLPATPVGLSWTSDSNALIAAAFSNDTHSPMQLFYYVEPSSGSVTPIVDFSQVPDLETLYGVVDEAGLPMRYYAPWTATLSPEGDKLLMYNDLGGVPGMLVAPLPPDGSKPTVIYRGEYSSSALSTRSSTSSDGKVLLYSNLFTIEE